MTTRSWNKSKKLSNGRESDSCRWRYNSIPTRPLIGVVGEIFCRLTEFSNNQLVRGLEEAGAEVWMNDISAWIWYIQRRPIPQAKTPGENHFICGGRSAYSQFSAKTSMHC
jgi:predicted nucleotide-binding protein (sugar kinase/HSP70/actin superfamily)